MALPLGSLAGLELSGSLWLANLLNELEFAVVASDAELLLLLSDELEPLLAEQTFKMRELSREVFELLLPPFAPFSDCVTLEPPLKPL